MKLLSKVFLLLFLLLMIEHCTYAPYQDWKPKQPAKAQTKRHKNYVPDREQSELK